MNPSAPWLRSQLGAYRFEALLARSSASLLFRARGIEAGEEVLVEIPREGLKDADGFVERMRRDAAAAAELQHPNVARTAITGVEDDTPYMVSPDPNGVELTPLVEGLGGLSMARAGNIICQIAGGLAAAHAAGLVHGTLEPARVLVTHRDGGDLAILTGFGFTPPPGSDGGAARPFGVPAAGFAAPEQIRGEEATPASDIYALGCVLYHSLLGESPAAGPDEAAILDAQLNHPPTPPRELAPELPAALDAVIARALAKDPEERFGSPDELAEAIMSITHDRAPGATVSERKKDTAEKWEQSIAGGAHTWSPSRPVISWPTAGSEDLAADTPDQESDGEVSEQRASGEAVQPAPIWPQPNLDQPAAPEPKEPAAKPVRKHRSAGRTLAALAAAAAVIVLGILLVTGDDSSDSGSDKAPAAADKKPATPAPADETPARAKLTGWPKRDAYTVIVFVSPGDRAGAERRARLAAARGFRAGVLRSDDYPNLPPGQAVGFAGVYDGRAEADAAALRVKRLGLARAPYVRRIQGSGS